MRSSTFFTSARPTRQQLLISTQDRSTSRDEATCLLFPVQCAISFSAQIPIMNTSLRVSGRTAMARPRSS